MGDAMLEAENWKIVVDRYAGHPIPALLLAHQMMALRQCLKRGKKGIPDAIAGLDLAIEALFPHTDFHKVSLKLGCTHFVRQKVKTLPWPIEKSCCFRLDRC
jgi:hypothetical protein